MKEKCKSKKDKRINFIEQNWAVLLDPILTTTKCHYCGHRLYKSRVKNENEHWCVNPKCTKTNTLGVF